MFKNIVLKLILFFGPICLGVTLMYLDGASGNLFTYGLQSGTGPAGHVGTLWFYLGWLFNLAYILHIWIQAIKGTK